MAFTYEIIFTCALTVIHDIIVPSCYGSCIESILRSGHQEPGLNVQHVMCSNIVTCSKQQHVSLVIYKSCRSRDLGHINTCHRLYSVGHVIAIYSIYG